MKLVHEFNDEINPSDFAGFIGYVVVLETEDDWVTGILDRVQQGESSTAYLTFRGSTNPSNVRMTNLKRVYRDEQWTLEMFR